MAPTFTLKLGGLDLSTYLRVNPDDRMDPQGAPWIVPAWTDTPFSDGQALVSTTVSNREIQLPLFLRDASGGKDQLHALIRQIQNAAAQRPLLLEWRDAGASASTFYDVQFVRFEPDFNFRRSTHGYAAGSLHVWTTGYGHTGTTRVCATAAGTGVFMNVPIPSVAGDAPALLDTTITAGAVVPSLGRIIAVSPLTQPSYTAWIPAGSLLGAQAGATLIGASGAQGSQYLALPVSPTGGASGVACLIPLANPTVMGGDNRVLGLVKAGVDGGIGIQGLDPYGNTLGPTAIASNSQGWALVDLGVCRLPTVGYPTVPQMKLYAGGLQASTVAPVILASPAGLAINGIIVLPDKNLTVIYESGNLSGGAGASVLSADKFAGNTIPLSGTSDQSANSWRAAYNLANAGDYTPTGGAIYELSGYLSQSLPQYYSQAGTTALLDANAVSGVNEPMIINAKVSFASPGLGFEEVDLLKDRQPSSFVRARMAASRFLSLMAATGGASGNLLASTALATIVAGAKYRLSLGLIGAQAWVNLSKDDGAEVYAPASMTQASIGVASNAAIAGAGNPGVAISMPSAFAYPWYPPAGAPQVSGWEVDSFAIAAVASAGVQRYDTYRISGVDRDSYRVSSAGDFGGQKLVAAQRGAFVAVQPSTVSLAVVCAPVDQGVANDLLSTVVAVKERFTYGR